MGYEANGIMGSRFIRSLWIMSVVALTWVMPNYLFAGTTVTITGSVSPSGTGDIKADSATGTSMVPSGTVSKSNTHTFYISPSTGNGFKSLTYDSVNVTSSVSCPSGIDNTCTYNAGDVGTSNHTISATFGTVYTVTATTATSGCGGANGGTISPASVKVIDGQSANFTIALNPGYALRDVKFGSTSDLAAIQYSGYTYTTPVITSSSSKTVEADFTPFFNLTTSITGTNGATGSISPSSAQVICNGSQTFTITTNGMATVSDVQVGGVSQGAVSSLTVSNVSASTNVSVTLTQTLSKINNYTITPPLVQAGVLPNMLLLIDNSASQYDLANDPTGKCKDNNSYVNSQTYYGSFEPGSTYSYIANNNRFEAGADMSGNCTFKSGFFCVSMTGTKVSAGGSGRTVNRFVATGNFLNWLSASKLDLQKKILTGGKYDVGNSNMVGESRGCMGRHYVKMISNTQQVSGSAEDLGNMTFVIRGPNNNEAGYNVATQGGLSRIEIYDSAYNSSACDTAIASWTSPGNQMGQAQQDATACMACSECGGTTSTLNLKMNSYLHMIHLCWNDLGGSGGGGGGQFNSIHGDCENIYTNIYSAFTPPSSGIVNDSAGDAVCSSVISHPLMASGNDLGYLGRCYIGGVWDPAAAPGGSSCSETQLADFCGQMQATKVTDPTGTIAGTTTVNTVPSFITDAGVNALGQVAGGPYKVNVYRATPPTNLLQEFAPYINFGAMIFNYDGSGSECLETTPASISSGTDTNIYCARHCTNTTQTCYKDSDCSTGTCDLNTKTNGGKVISYIGFDPVGDHSSGLIAAIDNIQATSWTPFAEAYYDAIGYFADRRTGSNVLRLQTGDFGGYCSVPTATSCTADVQCQSTPGRCVNGFCEKVCDSISDCPAGTCINRNPSTVTCRNNNILIITDGSSTADQKDSVHTLAQAYAGSARVTHPLTNTTWSMTSQTCGYAGSTDLEVLAWLAKNRDITDFTRTTTQSNKSITTYVAYNGPTATSTGACVAQNLMDYTAVAGGTDVGVNNATTGEGHAYRAIDYQEFIAAVRAAFEKASTNAASGTAASILNNSQGSGANLLQGFFYPSKVYETTTTENGKSIAHWIGELQNMWFYLDPYFATSTIREDTNKDYVLNLKDDDVVNFRFDTSGSPPKNQTVVDLVKDVNGDGSNYTTVTDSTRFTVSPYSGTGISPDAINSLWKAGDLLWRRDVSATGDPRTIYTVTSSSPGVSLVDFTSLAADTTVQGYLQAANTTEATKIINFVKGIDQTGYRSRKVAIDGCGLTDTEGCIREWKLGDLVNSTPKLASNIPLNTYSLNPPNGYGDSSYSSFVSSKDYKTRGMTFVGGNDGMLHAFKLGILDVSPQTTTVGSTTTVDRYKKARMVKSNLVTTATSSDNLGREEWAYIPRNVMPYLKYLADPTYNHLFYVDNTVSLFDASIHAPSDNDSTNFPSCDSSNYWNCQKKTALTTTCMTGVNSNVCALDKDKTSWRTLLIGGMGLGGASKNSTSTCTDGVSGTCTKTPVDGLGYSSYFALDVTDPENPVYLWEFSGDPANGDYLGYSLTGPAIVRVGDIKKNGKWLAVFASGPTGPIDTTTHSFMGKSDQTLKLFVVDIGTGTRVRTIDTGIKNAFAGSLSSAVLDTDRSSSANAGFYQDDVIYIGYTQTADDPVTSTSLFDKGGVIRLLTNENINPAQWTWSYLIKDIGPVTTSITKLQDRNSKYGNSSSAGKLWIYFGTGRFFYKNDSTTLQSKLYGIKDPCYSRNAGSPTFAMTGTTNRMATTDSYCAGISSATAVPTGAMVTESNLVNQDTIQTITDASYGWFIDLSTSATFTVNGASINYNAERLVTNPVSTPSGGVFFTTFMPTSDICGYNGYTYIWALKYDSGASPLPAAMKGKALIQVSTGALQQIDMTTAFGAMDGRRTTNPIIGIPPASGGMALMSNPKPVKKILHYQEK